MEQTKQIAKILNHIQDSGLRSDNPNSPRLIDNHAVADFLLYNGFRRTPVKPQSVVHNKQGHAFIVLEYTMKHDENGLSETVTIMHAEDKGSVCCATHTMSINDFWDAFGASLA